MPRQRVVVREIPGDFLVSVVRQRFSRRFRECDQCCFSEGEEIDRIALVERTSARIDADIRRARRNVRANNEPNTNSPLTVVNDDEFSP